MASQYLSLVDRDPRYVFPHCIRLPPNLTFQNILSLISMPMLLIGDNTQKIITQLLQADLQVVVVSEPEELTTHPIVQDILKTFISIPPPLSSDRPGCAPSLTIVANVPPSYSTTSARNALLSSYKRSLGTSLAAARGTTFSSDQIAGRGVRIQVVSSEAAIDSQAVFRRDQIAEALSSSSSTPSYAQSVSRFQTTLIDSGLPDLSKSLQSSLSSAPQPAFNVASSAIQRAQISLLDAQKEVRTTESVISQLRNTSSNVAHRYKDEVFSSSSNLVVSTSTLRSRDAVKRYLDGLKWWKLPWRIDEIGSEVGSIVRVEFGRELERKMVFATGRLEAEKERLDSSATAAVTSPSSNSGAKLSPLFHSPVLVNELEQLSSSTSASGLTPTTLLQPISTRLSQLTSPAGSPLMQLHYRAQLALLKGYSLSLGGPVASLGTYMYHGSSGGEEVALAVSVLSVVGGMRWVVGGWETAKKRWWESWGRIEEGLERDLKVCFVSTFSCIHILDVSSSHS